jgi:hypothetical protein
MAARQHPEANQENGTGKEQIGLNADKGLFKINQYKALLYIL